MLNALSAIGSIFSFLGAALKALIGLVIYRQGESAQAAKDQAATLNTVEREQQAAAQPKDTSKALGDGSF